MLLLRTERLPEGPDWLYELKLDGYWALAIKSYGVARLRSRNNKTFDGKYPAIVVALGPLSDETLSTAKSSHSTNPGGRHSTRFPERRRDGAALLLTSSTNWCSRRSSIAANTKTPRTKLLLGSGTLLKG